MRRSSNVANSRGARTHRLNDGGGHFRRSVRRRLRHQQRGWLFITTTLVVVVVYITILPRGGTAAVTAAATDDTRVGGPELDGLLDELRQSRSALLLCLEPLVKAGELCPELLETRRARLHAANQSGAQAHGIAAAAPALPQLVPAARSTGFIDRAAAAAAVPEHAASFVE